MTDWLSLVRFGVTPLLRSSTPSDRLGAVSSPLPHTTSFTTTSTGGSFYILVPVVPIGPVCLSVRLSDPSVCQTCLSVFLSVCRYVCLYVCLPVLGGCLCKYVCLSVRPVCLYVCLPVLGGCLCKYTPITRYFLITRRWLRGAMSVSPNKWKSHNR